ncbi:glycosyltransferase [Streptomyces sp. TR02-1]|uniref:glycosyltransferase n=1 Tax=Streptomyces sp. TR02-1 TaxID=3385977 RepID=UPI0039A3D314
MRVALMTAGSRGDVAPYTGLGHGLAAAGHEVTLVTHAPFRPLVAGAGVGFHALPVDPRAELTSEWGRSLNRSATDAGKLVKLARRARGLARLVADDLLAAARQNDVLLLSSSAAPLGCVLAEGLELPSIGVFLQPVAPTAEFGPPIAGGRSWGGPLNRLGGQVVEASVDLFFADTSRRLRARLGARATRAGAARRARERRGWPVVHGFSPLVVPRPRDWRPGLSVAGYWWPYAPGGDGLPPRVREFLDAGPPPVFVGLGSATVPDPQGLSRTVVRALRAAGLRGVIQRGWSGLDAAEASGGARDPDMLTVDEVPHAELFPHLAAVVHHAGAGTTAAGLRAGVPAVPVPVQFDGGFWARRLVSLGVAPAAVPLRRLDERSLGAALVRATGDPSYTRRARGLGTRIRAEDGVAPVLAALEQIGRG